MIEFGSKFKSEVLDGIIKASNAIKSTYGPYGSVVFVKSRYGGNKYTKDGYSVALALEDINNGDNSPEDIGINMVVECSKRINEMCGDSSTGVVVIFNELINQVRSLDIKPDKINEFIEKLEHDSETVINKLNELSKPVESVDDLVKIASTSANNTKLGELIANLVWKVRFNKIRIEQSQSGTYTEIIEGIQFPSYVPSLVLMNNMEDPYVFITNRTLTDYKKLVPVIQKSIDDNKPLFIICEDITPSVFGILEAYQERGQLNVSIIRSPYSGHMRDRFRRDLAKLFNTKVNTSATEIDDFINSVGLGSIKSLSFYNGSVNIILNDDSIKDKVIEDIKSEPYESEMLNQVKDDRISVISGNIGILHLYADSESEYKEVKDRIDDSINACKCSLKYGYSKGGGRAYLDVIEYIDNPTLVNALKSPSRILPEPNDKIIDSTWSLVQCVKISVSMLKTYLKLDYAVVNPIESLLDRR